MEKASHGRGTPRSEENPAALVTSSTYLCFSSVVGCEATTALLPRRGEQAKEERWGMLLPTEVGEEEPRGGEKLRIIASEDTAHLISTDPWYQVGFVVTTGINSSYVLGYSGSIMVPLDWIFGTTGLLLAAAISLYANFLVARLHEVGGRRQIRYRDLAGYVYGRKMYGLTWALQYVNLFMINTGYIILAGQALKATIKEPVIKNMEKALWFQFTIGGLPLYAVTFMGYWAYGSSTSTYLLSSVEGPVWVKTIANLASFLQTVIALHIFASPMYEYLDTKFGREGNPFSLENVLFRVLVRGAYLTINTLVSALLPFLGDFMSLTGALSTFPLTLVLANHMYLKVKKKKLSAPQRAWHWLNVVGFSCLAVTAAIAALRLIVFDSKTYHLLADL